MDESLSKENKTIIKPELLPLKDSNVYYVDNFFEKTIADKLMEKLMETILFGKKEREGRMTALYGHAKRYKYALNDAIPIIWTTELLFIKKEIEQYIKLMLPQYTLSLTSNDYNVCLLNFYFDGSEQFRYHSDREEIGNNVPIASISFGAVRNFNYKSIPKNGGNDNHWVSLGHGSLIIMDSKVHETHIHGLPEDKKIKEPRLNLTFRFSREKEESSEIVQANSEYTKINQESINNNSLLTQIVNRKTVSKYDIYWSPFYVWQSIYFQ